MLLLLPCMGLLTRSLSTACGYVTAWSICESHHATALGLLHASYASIGS